MDKADEAFEVWATANRASGPNRDRTVWRAAWSARGEADLAAVAAVKAMPFSLRACSSQGAESYRAACEAVERQIKEQG